MITDDQDKLDLYVCCNVYSQCISLHYVYIIDITFAGMIILMSIQPTTP